MEEEELEEFELLEQAAANASFSSNSSVVVRVLAKARGHVQDSKKVSSGQSVDSRGTHLRFHIVFKSKLNIFVSVYTIIVFTLHAFTADQGCSKGGY